MEINANPAQRLVWSADKNTLRYEVIIEKEEGGQYHLLQQEFTELAHFEISLPPGRYRYRVIPYDLRNRPGQGSDWESLDVVFSPREQVLNVFSPYTFDLNENIEWTFYVSGEKLTPESEIYLYHSESSRIFVPILTEILNNDEAWLAFTYDQLIPGIYEVYFINPGDLEARKGYFLLYRPDRVIAAEPPPDPPPPPPERPI
ncbi:MAG: hypothetical protein LBI06_01415 [Treponema sp.]|nr:hypothetical protein [Treponema sp.]